MKKKQTGFVSKNNVRLDYNHLVEINIQSFMFASDISFYNIIEGVNVNFSGLLNLASKLDVSQKTELTGFPTANGTSNENLDLIYEIRGNINYQPLNYLTIGLEGRYRYVPLKYSLQLARADNTFETVNYDTEEKTFFYGTYMMFNTELLYGLQPTVGFYIEKIQGVEKVSNSSYSLSNEYVSLGLRSSF
ncbi:hypothetical protein JHD50_05160 [Sulfurimonas sp. MAG313]|nr:hypothetical protein [Sulfurimonas sp. MAG313]MDF1880697.1 hypothetical protein [Sulfurimonas sp. MAG313]